MNEYDARILLFLNQFVGRWPWFDWLVSRADSTNLLSGGVVIAIFWYALFDGGDESLLRKRHELLLGATMFSGVAVLAARVLALSLPFRTRPIWSPDLQFHSLGAAIPVLRWSSFPSDHAALFFALATGIFFVSRPLGCLALGWVATVICFPLLYLGIHWPTDILAGAFLGVSFGCVARVSTVRDAVNRITSQWLHQQPGLLFAALFLWTYQIVTLFDDGRRLVFGLMQLVKR